jgi:hypothetical protein
MAFKDFAHWALMGIGSVLSVIPVVGPLVGGAIIAAGAAVPVSNSNSADAVSNGAAVLGAALNNANSYGVTATGGSVINVNSILTWVQTNLLLIVGVVSAIIFLPKLFKRSRR